VKTLPAEFEGQAIRRSYDEATETWWFSVVDVVQVLTQQADFQTARKYWNQLKRRLEKEGSESVTNCHRLKLPAADGKSYLTNIIHQEWSGVSVKDHKKVKSLKSQNLRDHMTEAKLIFSVLAELSTRQIAESTEATGLPANKTAAQAGGGIAKRARQQLESQTGRRVVSGENYLASPSKKSLKPPRKA
jgi:hypothetical protein